MLLPLGAAAGMSAGSSSESTQQGQLEAQHQLLLKSQPFKLECENEEDSSEGSGSSSAHLVLTTDPPAAPRSGGSLWRSASANAAGSAATPRLECRLAARVEVLQHSAAEGTASAASVSVTVAAGCYVSNLTGLPLAMLAEGAVTEAAAVKQAAEQAQQQQQQAALPDALLSPQSSTLSLASVGSTGSTTAMLGAGGGSGSSARQGMLLPDSATVPLLHLWHAASGTGQRAQRQGSWNGTSEMLRSFSGGLLPSPVQREAAAAAAAAAAAGRPALHFALVAPAPAGAGAAAEGAGIDADAEQPTPRPTLQQEEGQLAPTGDAAAAPGRCWSPALPPFAAAGRQRMYLQPPSATASGTGDAVMLSYRVLLSRGSFHLVLFR